MKRAYLIEDHDQALNIWRRNSIHNIDLVHVDAHIDFAFPPAKPAQAVIEEAQNIRQLKEGLENTIAYLRYEKNFSRQTDIGNYIYPAIKEGIVRDFFWVIPGGRQEFRRSRKIIFNIIKGICGLRDKKNIFFDSLRCAVDFKCLGRHFTFCILESLPVLKGRVSLDIDTDFLLVKSLRFAENNKEIGRRKPWIEASSLAGQLNKKILQPKLITIAYSVNGGFTPIRYRYLADELAFNFFPLEFSRRYKKNLDAAKNFCLFEDTVKKEYYWKAVKLSPAYRCQDNNYGPLYLLGRKINKAEKEFLKIKRADPFNPGACLGLGQVAAERKNFPKAKVYFKRVLKSGTRPFSQRLKDKALFGLARAEFNLRNFTQAKPLFLSAIKKRPLEPQGYFFLGCILRREKKFIPAAKAYQDAMRLGFNGIEPLLCLAQISFYIGGKKDIIGYVRAKLRMFKGKTMRNKTSLRKKMEKIREILKRHKEGKRYAK